MSKKNKIKTDILPLEDREALCPHFGMDGCGGCTYQKISYEKQLEIKASEVKKLLDGVYPCKTASEDDMADKDEPSGPVFDGYAFEGIVSSPFQEGYRNKMEFTFGDEYKGGPFALGLHKKGSFMNIVNITDCRLVHPDINIIRNTVKDYFEKLYDDGLVDFHNNRTHKGYLRHLLVRRSEKTKEILAALVTSSDFSAEGYYGCEQAHFSENIMLQGLVSKLQDLQLDGTITGILHITNDALSDIVKPEGTEVLYGRDYIYEEVLGLKFRISAFSFFQTNTLGAEILYSKVREYSGLWDGRQSEKCRLLFDLYCGTGTIAQLMSQTAENVVGVEIVEEAVQAARKNVELNGIKNVEFIAGDVLKATDTIGIPDALVLDPPREGIHPKALGKILSWNVENIVYVSCKPTSLARDLVSFKVAGYRLVRAVCVDMFPQTGHVETVALLSKVKG